MNEIEKAIDDLDDLKNCESISSSHFKEVHGKNLELAISALEKQIPKVAGCDMCDDTSNWRYFNNKGYKGCPYCLQAIDWSVEE